MTNEEAINIIEDVTWQDNGRHYGKIAHAREIAISALDKQIPKKPIENGIGGYICPHCGGVISDLSHELYHRDCGGRLE